MEKGEEQQPQMCNPNLTYLHQGNLDMNILRPTEHADDDSFKTGIPGNSRTSLTQRMKEVNVDDDSDKTKRKKKEDTDDTASSNSKRTRFNKINEE